MRQILVINFPITLVKVTDAPQSVRNSICLLEPKFMVQFRILFGHKFNGLFGDPLKFVDLIQSGKNWPLKCQDFVSGINDYSFLQQFMSNNKSKEF
jgi:hypothetical protein